MTSLLPYVPVWLMVLFRLTGMFVLAPVLGSQTIPRATKALLAMGLSFALWPMLWADPVASANLSEAIGGLNLWSLGMLMGFELLIGYVIGYAVSLPLIGMQLGGHLIDQQMGLAAAQLFNPEFGDESGITGQLLFMLALTMFVAAGGLEIMLGTLAQTFRVIPLGGFTHHEQIVQMVVGLAGLMFDIALRVAAPILCLMFLVSVGMGFIMRTVPQMNILSVGFSIRILSTVAVLIISLGAMTDAFDYLAGETLNRVMQFFMNPPPAVGEALLWR